MEENFDFNAILSSFNDDVITPAPQEIVDETDENEETEVQEGNDITEEETNENEEENTENAEESEEDSGEEKFILKFNGEEQEYSRDEIITLAQKGKNYDKVSEKWNAVKDNVDKWQDGWDFLEEMASLSKTDVKTMIESFRVKNYIAKAKAEGDILSEKTARARVQEEQDKKYRERKPLNDEEKKSKEIKEANEKKKKDFEDFYKEYSNVEAKDIPKEVWDDYKNSKGSKTLIDCYEKWDLKRLREEKKNASVKKKPASTKPVSKTGKDSVARVFADFNSDLRR